MVWLRLRASLDRSDSGALGAVGTGCCIQAVGRAARERDEVDFKLALTWLLTVELLRVPTSRTVEVDELWEVFATSWPKLRKISLTRALPVKPLVVEARSEVADAEGKRTVDAMRGRAGDMSIGTGDGGTRARVGTGGEFGAEPSDIDMSKSASASVRKGASPSMYRSLC